ncbi:MAG: hypothetical protein QGF16_09830, partial [Rhodospirillales bacterium]|nr:hypothetical protein [Rhodospirillales bacterium]
MKKITVFFVFACVAFFGAETVHSQSSDETMKGAKAAFKAGNFRKAFIIISKFAETGDADALSGRCFFHWHGLGTPEDTSAALTWCERASEKKSNAKEHFELLKAVITKVSSASNSKSAALKKLKELAEAGDGEAQWLMYRAHDNKLISPTKKDRDAISHWYKRAEQTGFPEALVHIARSWKRIFPNMEKENPELAKKYVSYLERAAKQKHVGAMGQLAAYFRPYGYYDSSKELPHKDFVKSTYWYRKASENSDKYY